MNKLFCNLLAFYNVEIKIAYESSGHLFSRTAMNAQNNFAMNKHKSVLREISLKASVTAQTSRKTAKNFGTEIFCSTVASRMLRLTRRGTRFSYRAFLKSLSDWI